MLIFGLFNLTPMGLSEQSRLYFVISTSLSAFSIIFLPLKLTNFTWQVVSADTTCAGQVLENTLTSKLTSSWPSDLKAKKYSIPFFGILEYGSSSVNTCNQRTIPSWCVSVHAYPLTRKNCLFRAIKCIS